MTRKQKQQHRQATPRVSEKQRSTREVYLLAELQRIGWKVTPTGPYQLFLQKAA